jgi:hypothetical protein
MIHVATWIGWNGVWNPCRRRADDEDGDAGGSSQPAQHGGFVVLVAVLVELLVHPQSASHPASVGMFQCQVASVWVWASATAIFRGMIV